MSFYWLVYVTITYRMFSTALCNFKRLITYRENLLVVIMNRADTTHHHCIVIDTDVEHAWSRRKHWFVLRPTMNELNMSKRAWTVDAREVTRSIQQARAQGPRFQRCLGWVITLAAMTGEVVNRRTNANSIGDSFSNVNIFSILIFGGHYRDRGPPGTKFNGI